MIGATKERRYGSFSVFGRLRLERLLFLNSFPAFKRRFSFFWQDMFCHMLSLSRQGGKWQVDYETSAEPDKEWQAQNF